MAPLRPPRRLPTTCGVLALLAVHVLGCSGATQTTRAFHQEHETTFRVGELPAKWKRIHVRGGDLVFKHAEGGTILANAVCRKIDDAPLDVLTNHLLFDIHVIQELSRKELTLDGRKALRSHIVGEVDGVPIELDLVVLRKDRCTYDLALIAGRETFDERRPDFEEFFEGFAQMG